MPALTKSLALELAPVRVNGQPARRRDPSKRDELTPQEIQIARFVAQGSGTRWDAESAAVVSERGIVERTPPHARTHRDRSEQLTLDV
jgi:hypothetical protein